MMIDYTYKPKAFSNTAIIDYSYFEMLYDLLEYSIPIRPETIIGLSIFAEAVVLHEELIPTNNMRLRTSNDYEESFLQQFVDKRVLYYSYDIGRGFIPVPDSGTECIYEELDFYEDRDDIVGYFQKLDDLANSHGIPSIRGIYKAFLGDISYDFKNLKDKVCKTIPSDLLSIIENDRSLYINQFKERLGNKYVGLPSIITIVLDRSKNIEDILNQILYLREEVTNFRDYSTKLHFDLRTEENFLQSCEILDEINNAGNAFNFDGNVKKKYRISQITPDISMDMISTSFNGAKKVAEFIESNKLKLREIGYYDLRNKAFDVKHNLITLKRLFGSAIDDDFVNRLNHLI